MHFVFGLQHQSVQTIIRLVGDYKQGPILGSMFDRALLSSPLLPELAYVDLKLCSLNFFRPSLREISDRHLPMLVNCPPSVGGGARIASVNEGEMIVCIAVLPRRVMSCVSTTVDMVVVHISIV